MAHEQSAVIHNQLPARMSAHCTKVRQKSPRTAKRALGKSPMNELAALTKVQQVKPPDKQN